MLLYRNATNVSTLATFVGCARVCTHVFACVCVSVCMYVYVCACEISRFPELALFLLDFRPECLSLYFLAWLLGLEPLVCVE